MSEIFNFKRFGTYFLYDLRQMWRKHSRAAILIGGSVVIFYVVWVLCSLVFAQHWSAPIVFSTGVLLFSGIIGFICNFLYFLLCGVCFKQHKIVWGIAIMCAFSMALSILFGLLVPILMFKMPMTDIDEMQAARIVVGLLNGTLALCCVLAVGLGWGVWRRVKTLQH